jgi:hypothetical protein
MLNADTLAAVFTLFGVITDEEAAVTLDNSPPVSAGGLGPVKQSTFQPTSAKHARFPLQSRGLTAFCQLRTSKGFRFRPGSVFEVDTFIDFLLSRCLVAGER